MMTDPTPSARRALTQVDTKLVQTADFTDQESQRVLRVVVCAIARELGREAAQEYFAELIRQSKAS
jgi:hypothetical protein